MKGINHVQLLGNLGQDPEMRYTANGEAVTTFSLATTRQYKSNNEYQEDTTWHKIVVWGKLAETCNSCLFKGSMVLVHGRINNRSWDDKQGVKHYVSEIVAEEVIFLDKKPVSADPAPAAAAEKLPGAPAITPLIP